MSMMLFFSRRFFWIQLSQLNWIKLEDMIYYFLMFKRCFQFSCSILMKRGGKNLRKISVYLKIRDTIFKEFIKMSNFRGRIIFFWLK